MVSTPLQVSSPPQQALQPPFTPLSEAASEGQELWAEVPSSVPSWRVFSLLGGPASSQQMRDKVSPSRVELWAERTGPGAGGTQPAV